ncbi:MAG: corrinoid protein [Defluviitaleaceae bacterium]|nr:corrinoid protein [Defluviitaleaceae bacterium]MCL2836627.1 corrinoid protein [Defluviitaleaceae bacterium]
MDKQTIYKSAADSILTANEELAVKVFSDAKSAGFDLLDLLGSGYGAGIQELGELFGKGRVFLPEVMMAAETMRKASELIEAELPPGTAAKKATIVIGTVAGDVHDIGKGIICALLKSNGYMVHDIGREVPAQVFIDKAEEVNADYIGSSALLTTTMPEQKKIEELLTKQGLRSKYKTLVGGAPVTKRWAQKIGADAYCENASELLAQLNEWQEVR